MTQIFLLPLAWLLFLIPSLLIDLKIVHILDVDIDFRQIIVHFLVQVDVYVLQENVSVECLHLLYTKEEKMRWDKDELHICIYLFIISYLPKPQADRYVCAIRHFHFWDVTHVHQTHGSSSNKYQ